jgi:undecaprenyl phosphate-alpha-L-ara4N flippase subunit ArnE
MKSYCALVIMSLLVACGQICIKKGSLRIVLGQGSIAFLKSFFNAYLVAGAVVVLAAPCFYFYALTELDLAVAYSFTALSYVLVAAGSAMILKEKLDYLHWCGIVLIAAGIVVFGL